VQRKKAIMLVLRIALSLGLLALLRFFIIPDFNTDDLLPDVTASTWWWLLAAFGFTVVAMFTSVIRWREVARVVGVADIGFFRFASHFFAGQFLSNFVPTTVGGDVLRVSRLSKDSDDSPHSFASVVFERLSGWLVLPVISLAGFAASSRLRDLDVATRVAIITAIVTLLALVLVLLLAGNDGTGRLLEGREGPLRWLNAIHVGLDSLRAHPGATWRILGAGFAYQLVLLSAAYCAVRAIGIDEVGILALCAFFPAVLIIQVLPLGIGGLGVREGAFVLFFSQLGVADEQSIALGFLLYLLTVASSILGLPALVLGGRNDPDGERDTTDIDHAEIGNTQVVPPINGAAVDATRPTTLEENALRQVGKSSGQS